MKSAALVLSGGGGLGVAHIGALRVLEQQYTFDYYAGVSAGAIVAAGHALGKSAEEISHIIHAQRFTSLAFDFSKSSYGIISGEKILKILRSQFGTTTFEDLKAKGVILKIYATDFQNGNQVCLETGEIALAVRASLSIPVLFEPIKHQGKWLVDGGLSENFPIQATLDQYSAKVIGIDVATSLDSKQTFDRRRKWFSKIRDKQAVFERTYRIMFASQQQFDKSNPRLTILQPQLQDFTTIDMKRLKEIEAAGKQCAEQCLIKN